MTINVVIVQQRSFERIPYNGYKSSSAESGIINLYYLSTDALLRIMFYVMQPAGIFKRAVFLFNNQAIFL
jgi:hypothetical protein